MVPAVDDDSLPRLLDEPDRARRNVREVFHKMAVECLTETLHIRKGMVAGEGVNRVLHRIGRDKLAVVPVRVGGIELALQPDSQAQLLEIMVAGVARNLG